MKLVIQFLCGLFVIWFCVYVLGVFVVIDLVLFKFFGGDDFDVCIDVVNQIVVLVNEDVFKIFNVLNSDVFYVIFVGDVFIVDDVGKVFNLVIDQIGLVFDDVEGIIVNNCLCGVVDGVFLGLKLFLLQCDQCLVVVGELFKNVDLVQILLIEKVFVKESDLQIKDVLQQV